MRKVGNARRQVLLGVVGVLHVFFEGLRSLADLLALGDSVACVLAGLLGLRDLRGELVDLPFEFFDLSDSSPTPFVR